MSDATSIQYWAYIVRCSDGSYYTGYTNNLDNRIIQHNCGKGAGYTKTRTPVELVYFERYADQHSAMHREYEIKQFTRQQKQALIANGKASGE